MTHKSEKESRRASSEPPIHEAYWHSEGRCDQESGGEGSTKKSSKERRGGRGRDMGMVDLDFDFHVLRRDLPQLPQHAVGQVCTRRVRVKGTRKKRAARWGEESAPFRLEVPPVRMMDL